MNIIILLLTLLLSSTSLVKPNVIDAEDLTKNNVSYFENITHYWEMFEDTMLETFNSLTEYFETIFHIPNCPKFKYDLTIVGFVNSGDGIGNHPILFKKCLGDSVTINFVSTRDIPANIEDAQLGLDRLNPAHKKDIGAVSILTDILADKAVSPYKNVPDSPIKIAYTMFESTEIPPCWVQILNKKFDMAVVPDQFLVHVYKKCGVQIPIFVLPLPLMLGDFLKLKPPVAQKNPFVFGMSGGFWKRKNHMRVLEAFAAEFGNRSDVRLRLHGRFGEESIIKDLADKIAKDKLTNVELVVKAYTREEYINFFQSLDCYVFLSQGEGFSITPREILACGKPCILTNNTAQTSICKTGSVRVVPSNILIPALYDCHYSTNNCCYGSGYPACTINNDDIDISCCTSKTLGYQFDCTVEDAQKALRDVYENYDCYLAKARHGKEWVKRYLPERLHHKYLNLVKPESIFLGEENIIEDQFLMTNSPLLYEKYQSIICDDRC